MKSRETTARASSDLDATDEFPVLDAAAYEAEVGSSERRTIASGTTAASHAEQAALIATLRGRMEDLTARLATSETERHALEERVAALTRDVSDRYSRLKRLESMNAELRETVGRLSTSLAERSGLQRDRRNHLNEHLRPLADAIERR